MGRGGARKGAGRPRSGRQGTSVSFWVSKETKERLRALRAEGYDTSLGLETAVGEWYRELHGEEGEDGA